MEQEIDLTRILSQLVEEIRHALDLPNLHAPLHLAQDRIVLVAAEIVPGVRPQQGAKLTEGLCGFAVLAVGSLGPIDRTRLAEVVGELRRHRLGR
jgi:hypothetical protein